LLPCLCERLDLMRVQCQRLWIPVRFSRLEDLSAGGMQISGFSELLDSGLPLVVWIDLDQGLRPIAPLGVLSLNFAANVWSRDTSEAPRKYAVLLDQLIPE
jgi:hypothetical protein